MLWPLLGFVLFLVTCGGDGDPLASTEWRLIALGNADAPLAAAAGDAGAEFGDGAELTGWTG